MTKSSFLIMNISNKLKKIMLDFLKLLKALIFYQHISIRSIKEGIKKDIKK